MRQAEPQLYYMQEGGLGLGYNSDMRQFVGDSVLASVIANWGTIYAPFVRMLLDGSGWAPNAQTWPGIAWLQ